MLERPLAMKTILFASVAMLALAAAAPAFAQTPPAEKPAAAVAKPAADKPAKPAKPTPAATSAKDHTLAGTVKAFDADKHMLTFASGKEFTLDAAITDTFKAGDKVSVHYTKSGEHRMADKVTKN
jgi:hypothetical protein